MPLTAGRAATTFATLMNRRHKTVFAISLAVAGLSLLNGAKLTEGLGIILVGGSIAWLVGSGFVLASAKFVWRHRVWSSIIIMLAIGAVYGWIRYDAYETEKREAAYQAKMKPVWDCERRNSQFSNADAECEKDPTVTLHPITQPAITPSYTPSPHSPVRSSSRHVKTLINTDLTSAEYGTLTCGHIRTGETAVLLIEDGPYVRIRTADGQVGWASGSNFEVVGQ